DEERAKRFGDPLGALRRGLSLRGDLFDLAMPAERVLHLRAQLCQFALSRGACGLERDLEFHLRISDSLTNDAVRRGLGQPMRTRTGWRKSFTDRRKPAGASR